MPRCQLRDGKGSGKNTQKVRVPTLVGTGLLAGSQQCPRPLKKLRHTATTTPLHQHLSSRLFPQTCQSLGPALNHQNGQHQAAADFRLPATVARPLGTGPCLALALCFAAGRAITMSPRHFQRTTVIGDAGAAAAIASRFSHIL